jgi:hypothetical protein
VEYFCGPWLTIVCRQHLLFADKADISQGRSNFGNFAEAVPISLSNARQKLTSSDDQQFLEV